MTLLGLPRRTGMPSPIENAVGKISLIIKTSQCLLRLQHQTYGYSDVLSKSAGDVFTHFRNKIHKQWPVSARHGITLLQWKSERDNDLMLREGWEVIDIPGGATACSKVRRLHTLVLLQLMSPKLCAQVAIPYLKVHNSICRLRSYDACKLKSHAKSFC